MKFHFPFLQYLKDIFSGPDTFNASNSYSNSSEDQKERLRVYNHFNKTVRKNRKPAIIVDGFTEKVLPYRYSMPEKTKQSNVKGRNLTINEELEQLEAAFKKWDKNTKK